MSHKLEISDNNYDDPFKNVQVLSVSRAVLCLELDKKSYE
jgi:hypothetical protein